MDLRIVQDELRRLSELIGGWSGSAEVSSLERELALEKLRRLYDAVRFGGAPAGAAATGEAADAPDESPALETLDLDVIMPSDFPEPESEPTPAPAAEPPVEPAPAVEPQSEPPVEPAPAVDPEPQPQPDPSAEPQPEPAPSTPVMAALFEVDVADDSERRQRIILSLYDNDPIPAAEPAAAQNAAAPSPASAQSAAAPQAAPDPAPQYAPHTAPAARTVLGETINHDRQTLSDTIPAPHDRAWELNHREPLTDIRLAIGLNDRFLIIRDLFNGDGEACEKALDVLNGFDNLDDCMIHIAENYAWSANSDGAKLLMELLERKFI